MPTVNTGTELRSAIQVIGTSDPIELQGTGSFSSAVTLGKLSSTNPAPVPYSGYTIQGAGTSAATSATLEDTRIYQQNTDSAFLPGTVQNLTLNYSSSSNGRPLLSIEPKGAQTPTQTLTIKNVDFTGTTTGWNGNGNLYMSLRSFNDTTAGRLNTTFTLDSVKVSITGQNNGFNGTTGGSAFFHNWNNTGVVSILNSNFDEAGFRSSFNFYNFSAPASATAAPINLITGNTFRRSSSANVRNEGNLLGNVNATLSSNIFQDGAYVDLIANVSGITFNSNTFNTITDGYGIRVTSPNTGSPTFSGTNTFTGPGLALKYVSATTNARIHYTGSFNVTDAATGPSGKSFNRLVAGGQGNDNLNYLSPINFPGNSWISGDSGQDTIISGGGNDYLIGGADNDRLIANSGDDILDGGSGDDLLNGGDGNDTLIGGSGADQFLYISGNESDSLIDFSISDGDQLRLGSVSFANTASGNTLATEDYQTVASLVAATPMNLLVTELTSDYSAASANTFTTTAAANGYLLFFDSTSNTSWLYYDNNWADTASRQAAIHLTNINSLAALTAFSNTEIRRS
jgi:hypothetical protein